ncbi:hypothetical protein Nepgr_031765 [Nepenthes gracilis]|uniref:Uncharacterized protein n=1 Tax=Nepenthes gracilis TaxID=150966 RepID=A0AAD3Y541_NEPGR|nr:hypothetical protein Nepgr_031765 [Nepenthes gracilis]
MCSADIFPISDQEVTLLGAFDPGSEPGEIMQDGRGSLSPEVVHQSADSLLESSFGVGFLGIGVAPIQPLPGCSCLRPTSDPKTCRNQILLDSQCCSLAGNAVRMGCEDNPVLPSVDEDFALSPDSSPGFSMEQTVLRVTASGVGGSAACEAAELLAPGNFILTVVVVGVTISPCGVPLLVESDAGIWGGIGIAVDCRMRIPSLCEDRWMGVFGWHFGCFNSVELAGRFLGGVCMVALKLHPAACLFPEDVGNGGWCAAVPGIGVSAAFVAAAHKIYLELACYAVWVLTCNLQHRLGESPFYTCLAYGPFAGMLTGCWILPGILCRSEKCILVSLARFLWWWILLALHPLLVEGFIICIVAVHIVDAVG